MSDSPTKWKTPSSDTHDPNSHQPTTPINEQNLLIINENDATNKIPVEIVSEEEMALLEAALSLAAAAAVRPSSLSCSPRLPSRLSVLCSELGQNSKRTFSNSNVAAPSSLCDLEDSDGLITPNNKKFKLPQTFLTRFRRKKGLYVTDLTATEWCEKQMEFSLRFGKPESTPAMKAGSARHAMLEEEVIKG